MKDNKVFIIAEIGSNHNQDINRAFELMEIAKDAGADAVKFQSLRLDKLMAKKDISLDDKQLFAKIKLEEGWYDRLFKYAKELGIECISAPTYLEAIPLLLNCGAKYMKIASPQTYGYPQLIKEIAKADIPTFLSTGYCIMPEIKRAVELFEKYGNKDNLTVFHCIAEYPTEYSHVNLQYMNRIKELFGVKVGYSDHTMNNLAVCSAVAMGATAIEKHITINREDEGPDHFFAAEPHEFKEMVEQIRQIEDILGNGEKKLTEFETEFRNSIVMYPYAKKNIEKGEILREEDIEYYRSKTQGMSPWRIISECIDSPLKEDIIKGEKIIL